MITLCSVLATYVMHRQETKLEKEVVGKLKSITQRFENFIDADECLHQSNCVSMNLHGENLKCNC